MKKYTKRQKEKIVKDINKDKSTLHEQILITIYNYEKEKSIIIPCSSNNSKTLIDFGKFDNELIFRLENLYTTFKSNEQYLKQTDIQYAQSKDNMNIVLSS
jgi:hypothetical protein